MFVCSYVRVYVCLCVRVCVCVVCIHVQVSGCEKHKVWKEDAIKAMKPFPNANLHFTPDFSELKGDKYPPYNRPHGFKHWLDHVDVKERVIVVIDPDMLFMKPIIQHGSLQQDLVSSVRYDSQFSLR